jgi:uncharacterized protein YjbI with pentapeptide repeats
MSQAFTPEGLVEAISSLFKLNNYEVKGPLKIHGAEVDLVAKPKFDPFGAAIYIEATIEHVDNDKYGKDVGKLALIGEKEPGARRLIVSSTGFSLPVVERAKQTRIETLTYDELFAKFEQFDSYINIYHSADAVGRELTELNQVYEEPDFNDKVGREKATPYLTKWRDDSASANKWLILVGEYGTGKTALTKVLQYRWLQNYKQNAVHPIPFRIELRDFTRQFDARGLLHHFLDSNQLGHVPIEFVFSLIKSRRIILLLDGYDEMAQYLHARERRTCLEALAQLAADGAKGILTSRPNYFTETEELQVFEVLYASLKHGQYYIGRLDKHVIEKEREVDQLLAQFLDRFERSLEDLSPAQTEALVRKVLATDRAGQEVVLAILKRIFRGVEDGEARSLSGKPVIITYLLEVLEGLKTSKIEGEGEANSLTEWQVYKLIIDQLMVRDFKRSPQIMPEDRRRLLHAVSLQLSQRESPSLDEEEFKNIIGKVFERPLRDRPGSDRQQELERYFSDLRSSATLTRSAILGKPGWRFSHNSIREFLVAEFLIRELEDGRVVATHMAISDAMKIFVASRPASIRDSLASDLAGLWGQRHESPRGYGQLFALIYDAALKNFLGKDDPVQSCLRHITGNVIAMNGVSLMRLEFANERAPANLDGANFAECELTEIGFSSASLKGAAFTNTLLENVAFDGSDLTGAHFMGATILDCIFVNAVVVDADFRGVSPKEITIVVEGERAGDLLLLDGERALGYLNYRGAITDELPRIVILANHPNFEIVEKVLEKLSESALRQRRGLEQRGAARQNVVFARKLVDELESSGFIIAPKGRKDMVEVSPKGRDMLATFLQAKTLPNELIAFLEKN